jgi:S-adenosylmethionine:tRNA ribosyltransferase-isomerase
MLAYPFYVTNKNIDPRYYQTVFAKKQAESLAAPTAGLHFSNQLLRKLKNKGVKIVKLSLHISFGTFMPIYDLKNHKMQPEFMEISKQAAQTINKRTGRLFCVGTTVVKALETASDKDGNINPLKGDSTLFITPRYKLKTKISGLITNFHMPQSSLLLLVSSFYDRKKLLNAYKLAIKKNYRFLSFGDAMIIIK